MKRKNRSNKFACKRVEVPRKKWNIQSWKTIFKICKLTLFPRLDDKGFIPQQNALLQFLGVGWHRSWLLTHPPIRDRVPNSNFYAMKTNNWLKIKRVSVYNFGLERMTLRDLKFERVKTFTTRPDFRKLLYTVGDSLMVSLM